MKQIKYLKDNDIVGVTACSCGILDKVDRYETSVNNFKKHNLNVVETPNVRTNGFVSTDAKTRWNELKSLLENDNVNMINIASGGDYLEEVLDYVDYDLINQKGKLIGGSSDPTSLLFTVTTKLDLPTIYTPCNMAGFDQQELHESLENYFKIIKGEKIRQNWFPKYELIEDKTIDGYNLNESNEWININCNELEESGLLIGGCMESIKDIIGTKYDYVNEFLDRHKDENIIWYFDVFAMSAEGVSMTLRQFNNAGWFKNTKSILIGKVKYKPPYVQNTYEDAIKRAITDIPVVYQFDVGHVKPSFTLINGSNVKIVSNRAEKYIEFID